MNHGHHQHSVHTTPDGGTTTTTTAPIVVDGTSPVNPAPAPTTVVVTAPAPAGATQSVSLSAMLMIAIGAALAGGAAVYFWPTLVGEAEAAAGSSEATENPIRKRRKKSRRAK